MSFSTHDYSDYVMEGAKDEVNRLKRIVYEQDSELAELIKDRDAAYRKLDAIKRAIKRDS